MNLETRIERLERSNSRLRLALTLAVVAAMTAAAVPPRSLEVRDLKIVDDAGTVRAKCAVNESGSVGFDVFTSAGELGGTFGVSDKGVPNLALYGRKDGKPFVRAYVALFNAGPRIALVDEDGEDLFRVPPQK